MKGSLYARFLERRGRRIYEAAGCYWHTVEPRMVMSIPYHEPMEPDPDQVMDLLRRTRTVGARYLAPEGCGLEGGLYVRRKAPYDLSSVHSKARNRQRHALERCTVREVEPSELLNAGLELNRDTMQRQGRYDAEFDDPKQWRRLVDACASPGVKVMGAYFEGELAAYCVTLTEDRWVHLVHQFSATRFLNKAFPNEALTFELTRQAAEDPDSDQISYGVAGLVRGEGLHEYKLRHGYQFQPFGYAFLLHPVARVSLVNPVSGWALGAARKRWPGLQALERVGSVMEGARQTLRPSIAPPLSGEIGCAR
jgi:hypothetical protein